MLCQQHAIIVMVKDRQLIIQPVTELLVGIVEALVYRGKREKLEHAFPQAR